MFGKDVGSLGERENKKLPQGDTVGTEVNKVQPQGGEPLKESEANASSVSLQTTDVVSQSLVV